MSFPLVGNPSFKKDAGQASMTDRKDTRQAGMIEREKGWILDKPE